MTISKSVIFSLTAAALLLLCAVFFSFKMFHNTFGRPGIAVDLSRAEVIRQIRDLNRLESASFTIDKVVEAGTKGNTFQQALYGDRLLLVAQGEVIAGVDLSKLNEDAIRVSGKNLSVKLPPAEVLTVRLDNQKTRVYDRKLGLFSKGDKDLETKVRQSAEDSIRSAALESGILKTAEDSACKQLAALFKSIGFSNAEISF